MYGTTERERERKRERKKEREKERKRERERERRRREGEKEREREREREKDRKTEREKERKREREKLRKRGDIVQYVTAEWKPAFLRQAREFLFFPLLPRKASKSVSIFDGMITPLSAWGQRAHGARTRTHCVTS